MSLVVYQKKRNFKSTQEPKGKITPRKVTKFVIQYHEARTNHYDLRLEHKGVLLSWAVPKGLSSNPKDKRLAVHVEDHPLEYANFEGVIPKGNYGAGTVKIFDEGDYVPLTEFEEGLKQGHLNFFLNGEKLIGAWSLIQFKNQNWFVVKINDDFLNTKIIETKQILPFKNITVQLATLTHTIPAGKDWLFEFKYDGYRMLAFAENHKIKMITRNGQDYTKKLPTIATSLSELEKVSFVLDGEVVCFNKEGKSDFGLLQAGIKSGKNNLHYCVFDLLALNGVDLRNLPLIVRKQHLERLLSQTNDNLIYSKHTTEGHKTLAFAQAHNLEGIIAKQKHSKYSGSRTNDWLKIKCYCRQEFIITGYTTSPNNELLSSLILGCYKGKDLIYVGKTGTGFSEKDKQQLIKIFQTVLTEKSPFPHSVKLNNVIWLKPKFVAEVQFTELTKDNLLRQASFIALRYDKNIEDVVWEI